MPVTLVRSFVGKHLSLYRGSQLGLRVCTYFRKCEDTGIHLVYAQVKEMIWDRFSE